MVHCTKLVQRHERIFGETALNTLTSLTLLEGLRDITNRAAWERFAERYQPMIMAFALRQRLSEADAEDAAQETVLAFVAGYREGVYSRDKGRLRSWLFGVALRKVRDIQRRRGREIQTADRSDATGLLAAIESPDTTEQAWDEEWERLVLRACLEEAARHFDPSTWQAFELYVLQEWPTERVAAQVGISRNAVYIAKNRVLSRLRELRTQMAEVW